MEPGLRKHGFFLLPDSNSGAASAVPSPRGRRDLAIDDQIERSQSHDRIHGGSQSEVRIHDGMQSPEGPSGLVAIESKCTEYLTPNPAQFSERYETAITDERASGPWYAEMLRLKGGAGYQFLDDAQLIKHAFGLAHNPTWSGARRPALARQGLRRLHDFRHREMHVGEHIIWRPPALRNVAHSQHAHARPIARGGGRFGDFAADAADIAILHGQDRRTGAACEPEHRRRIQRQRIGVDYRRGDAERLQCLCGFEAAMDEISGTGEHNGRPIRLGAADQLIAAEGEAFALAIEDRQVAAHRA